MKIEKKSLVFVLGGVLFLFIDLLLCQFICNRFSICLIPTSTPSPVSEIFKVTRVIDGDMIEIEGGERVRYLGIDAPETVDLPAGRQVPRKPVQCFGVEASKKNKELVEGKTVHLGKDITDRDKYGRLLRYVWSGDLFVNLELVRQGFAFSYTYPPDVKHQPEILEAERQAREANCGLWKACPLVSP